MVTVPNKPFVDETSNKMRPSSASELLATPQKSLNKKKSKGADGMAVPSKVNDVNDKGSAALLESDRRMQ